MPLRICWEFVTPLTESNLVSTIDLKRPDPNMAMCSIRGFNPRKKYNCAILPLQSLLINHELLKFLKSKAATGMYTDFCELVCVRAVPNLSLTCKVTTFSGKLHYLVGHSVTVRS
jgi:hypothetical protein